MKVEYNYSQYNSLVHDFVFSIASGSELQGLQIMQCICTELYYKQNPS